MALYIKVKEELQECTPRGFLDVDIPPTPCSGDIDQRIRDRGLLRPNMSETGRPRSLTPDVEEAILRLVEDEPSISSREIARHVELNQSNVLRIFREQLLYHFHPQLIQCLNPEDYPRRRQFYEWFLHQSEVVPDFTSCPLFSDEPAFTRDSVFNTHNQHIRDQINPLAFTVRSHQVSFSINIWCGIIHNTLLGPHVMKNRLIGANYRDFLVNILPVLLEAARARTWFQHDGAPAHFSHLEK